MVRVQLVQPDCLPEITVAASLAVEERKVKHDENVGLDYRSYPQHETSLPAGRESAAKATKTSLRTAQSSRISPTRGLGRRSPGLISGTLPSPNRSRRFETGSLFRLAFGANSEEVQTMGHRLKPVLPGNLFFQIVRETFINRDHLRAARANQVMMMFVIPVGN